MLSKMARFYGWSDEYLREMEADKFLAYWLAITPIESQEVLNQITATSFSNLKKGDRSKVHKELKKNTRFLIEQDDATILTTEEAANKLARKLMISG